LAAVSSTTSKTGLSPPAERAPFPPAARAEPALLPSPGGFGERSASRAAARAARASNPVSIIGASPFDHDRGKDRSLKAPFASFASHSNIRDIARREQRPYRKGGASGACRGESVEKNGGTRRRESALDRPKERTKGMPAGEGAPRDDRFENAFQKDKIGERTSMHLNSKVFSAFEDPRP